MNEKWVGQMREIHWERFLIRGGLVEHILWSPDIGILNEYVVLIVCRHLTGGWRCNSCHVLSCSPFFILSCTKLILLKVSIDFDLFLEIIRLALIRWKRKRKKKRLSHTVRTHNIYARKQFFLSLDKNSVEVRQSC